MRVSIFVLGGHAEYAHFETQESVCTLWQGPEVTPTKFEFRCWQTFQSANRTFKSTVRAVARLWHPLTPCSKLAPARVGKGLVGIGLVDGPAGTQAWLLAVQDDEEEKNGANSKT